MCFFSLFQSTAAGPVGPIPGPAPLPAAGDCSCKTGCATTPPLSTVAWTAPGTGSRTSRATSTVAHVIQKQCFHKLIEKMQYFNRPAEWNTWQAWGSCSVTCNYGIRQRSRTCNPDGQCAGMGSYQDSEYCTLGSCHSGSSGSSKETLPCAIGAQVGGIAVLCSFQNYVYCS